MRVSFRTKIFLGLGLTVITVLGITLMIVDGSFTTQIKTLISSRVTQGQQTFNTLMRYQKDELVTEAFHLVADPHFQSGMEQIENLEKLNQQIMSQYQQLDMHGQFIAVVDRSGHIVMRLMRPRGAPLPDTLPLDPSKEYPEAALVADVKKDSDDWPEDFFETGGRLFHAVAGPVVDNDIYRGVLVIGTELTSIQANVLHGAQDKDDGIGFPAGGRLNSNFASEQPFLDAVRDLPLGDEGARRTIEKHPYHVVRKPIDKAKKLSSVQFISLKSLLDVRENMTRLILYTAAGAILLALLVGIAISRGISRPVWALVQGTQLVAKGDYSHRIPIPSKDELGDLAAAFNTMAGDLSTKEKVRAVLNKVVAREVADELLSSDLGLGGRLLRATLLFADLRNFTGMTQKMQPQDVVSMLNEFMTEMSREILDSKGIVDKYVGDEIIGVFGAPKSHGNDARAAVEAADRMRRRLGILNEARARRGDPPLAMGVGIHTGEVVAGCMGSEQLMSYTCIGAAMNLAARLCSNSKPGQILISEDTQKEIGDDVNITKLTPIQVKGFTHAISVYEVNSLVSRETARRNAPKGDES